MKLIVLFSISILVSCSGGRGYGDDDPDWLARPSKGVSDGAVRWCRHQVTEMDPIVRAQFAIGEIPSAHWPCVVSSAMSRCLMLCYNLEHNENCPIEFIQQIARAERASTPQCSKLSEAEQTAVDDASIQFRLMRFLRTELEKETDCKMH